jgi:hypothetical protein
MLPLQTPLAWVGPLLLCRSEVERVPPAIPGVYLLHLYSHEFGGYPVFYAGQSLDLRRRLSEHLGDRTTKAVIAAVRASGSAYFSAAPVMETQMLSRIETSLISALRPPCNEVVPAVAPLLVNLPPLFLIPR